MILTTLRVTVSALVVTFGSAAYAEKAPDAVNPIVPSLSELGTNATLIKSVQEHNAKGLTLEAIQARDAEWRKVDGMDAQMTEMTQNSAAQTLLEFEKSQPYFFELFLMGNQGANIAMTNKTSDYWQGDEAKWQKSFNNGTGAVQIGDVEFDESAQAYLVQVSVPVMDGGQAIGAITIGINLDELEAQ